MNLLRLVRICLGSAVILASSFSFSGCFNAAISAEKKVNVEATPPARGPEDALLSIEQFTDFSCPYCVEQAKVFKQVMQTYPGKIRMAFRHLPISGEPGTGSFPIHEASMCAWEQARFWEFHDAVFNLSKNTDFPELVRLANLDQAKFYSCFNEHRYRDYILADMEEAQKRAVSGTPTFFINDEKVSGLRTFEYFAEKVDPDFAKKVQAERKRAEDELLEKINLSEEGRPATGTEKALVTITEFSDFHCPFCTRLTATIQQVLESYPGEVRRVWRHFPLPIHPASPYAHLGSECAHQQGQFWEFHKKVFADANAARSKDDMLRIATEIKLDTELFKTCYEDPETRKKIENDVLLGMYRKVSSTPTLFINDEMVVGAQPLDKLKTIVERKMEESRKP